MRQPVPSKSIVFLKHAIAEERREPQQRLQRYKALTKKMNKYQQGTGPAPAPSSEEFEQWRTDVEAFIALKLVQPGIGSLTPRTTST